MPKSTYSVYTPVGVEHPLDPVYLLEGDAVVQKLVVVLTGNDAAEHMLWESASFPAEQHFLTRNRRTAPEGAFCRCHLLL